MVVGLGRISTDRSGCQGWYSSTLHILVPMFSCTMNCLKLPFRASRWYQVGRTCSARLAILGAAGASNWGAHQGFNLQWSLRFHNQSYSTTTIVTGKPASDIHARRLQRKPNKQVRTVKISKMPMPLINQTGYHVEYSTLCNIRYLEKLDRWAQKQRACRETNNNIQAKRLSRTRTSATINKAKTQYVWNETRNTEYQAKVITGMFTRWKTEY